MLDNLKLRTYNRELISLLSESGDFVACGKSRNNIKEIKRHKISDKIKLYLYRNSLNECTYLELSISPHYHFNDYRHNGNDFSVKDCQNTLLDILDLIGIKRAEMQELQVVNLEFGVNVIPDVDVMKIINGVAYYKKTPFVYKNGLTSFKITDTNTEKQIKIYAKGIQCHEVLNAPEIDKNTLRFEVKTKKSRYVKKLGIYSFADFFRDEVYSRLGEELIKNFNHILILYPNADLSPLNDKEKEFITKANKIDFWKEIISDNNRNKYSRYKTKYTKIMTSKKIKHAEHLHQKISKKITQKSGAFSPYNTIDNQEVKKRDLCNSTPIRCENAPLFTNSLIKHLNNRVRFFLGQEGGLNNSTG